MEVPWELKALYPPDLKNSMWDYWIKCMNILTFICIAGDNFTLYTHTHLLKSSQ